jgi:hypothetical protein
MVQFPFTNYKTVAVDSSDTDSQVLWYTATAKSLVTFEPDRNLTDCQASAIGASWGLHVDTFTGGSGSVLKLMHKTDLTESSNGFYSCSPAVLKSGDTVRSISRFGRVTGTLHIFELP